MLFLFFESHKKLLENSYIDDSIVCIVRKKVDNKLINSPYVSLLWDILQPQLFQLQRSVYLIDIAFVFIYFYGPHIFNMAPIFGYQQALGLLLFRSWAEHCIHFQQKPQISYDISIILYRYKYRISHIDRYTALTCVQLLSRRNVRNYTKMYHRQLQGEEFVDRSQKISDTFSVCIYSPTC